MLNYSLLFFDVSGGEFIVIIMAAFFIFGPKRLPEIARKLGRAMNEIKSVSGEMTREFQNETKNITSEFKSAREAVRLESIMMDETIATNQPVGETQNTTATKTSQNNTPSDKLKDAVGVTYENSNKVKENDVNSETGSNI